MFCGKLSFLSEMGSLYPELGETTRWALYSWSSCCNVTMSPHWFTYSYMGQMKH